MLQQTTVATVLGRHYYTNFLTQFPTPKNLADATEESVLAAWEGLGYYSRARNLQKTARSILSDHQGVFPTDFDDILKLPGVGPYTAGAVASFAFDQSRPIVDGNIARVLSRLMDMHDEIDSSAGQKKLWSWASQLVPQQGARVFNSAIMELGQTICKKGRPDCLACPISQFCQTREPENLPKKKPRRAYVAVTEHTVFSQREDDAAILLAREEGSRRKGFWKLPERQAEQISDLQQILQMPYTITHHKVSLHIYAATPEQTTLQDNEKWVSLDEISKIPVAAPYRKALKKLAPEI